MKQEQADALRAPFPPEAIGQLPRAGIKLDYVGHAAVCDRLLQVDPDWTWEPFATNEHGVPQIMYGTKEATLWIRLTVAGVTRPGVGIAALSAFELEKQLISDALRNAAMRFGVALDLWSKEDLGSHPVDNSTQGFPSGSPSLTPDNSGAAPISPSRVAKLQSRASALTAAGISVAEQRQAMGLPTIKASDAGELDVWEALLASLEDETAPFEPRNEDGTAAPSLLDTGKTLDQGREAKETAPL